MCMCICSMLHKLNAIIMKVRLFFLLLTCAPPNQPTSILDLVPLCPAPLHIHRSLCLHLKCAASLHSVYIEEII